MPAFGKPNLRYQLLKQRNPMKWIRRLLKSDFVFRIFAFLAALYIRLVFVSCKWEVLGKEIPESYLQAGKSFIVCFWHGRLGMLACAWTWKDHPFRMLLSAHRDGQLIGQTVAHFTINVIPRKENDGVNLQWQAKQLSEEEMSTVELELKEQTKNIGHFEKEVKKTKIEPPKAQFLSEDDEYFTRQMRRVP